MIAEGQSLAPVSVDLEKLRSVPFEPSDFLSIVCVSSEADQACDTSRISDTLPH